MKTKYELAEQALRILSGGDIQKDSDTQIREMMKVISQARDMLVRQELWQLMTMGDIIDISGEYISTYDDVKVSYDERKKVMYSTLPAQYINLPRNMGVYHISLMEDQFNAFIPTHAHFRSLYNNLQSQRLEGRIGYWIEGDKIYYQGIDKTDHIPEVCMKLIVASNEIDDEDEMFPIPPDKELDVIKLALELYGMQKQIPNDQINDNIDE